MSEEKILLQKSQQKYTTLKNINILCIFWGNPHCFVAYIHHSKFIYKFLSSVHNSYHNIIWPPNWEAHGQGVLIAWSLQQNWAEHILMIQCKNFHFYKPMWCCTMKGTVFFLYGDNSLKADDAYRFITHFSHWNTTGTQNGKSAFEQNSFIPGCSYTT